MDQQLLVMVMQMNQTIGKLEAEIEELKKDNEKFGKKYEELTELVGNLKGTLESFQTQMGKGEVNFNVQSDNVNSIDASTKNEIKK